MAAVETRVCETDGCSSEAKLQCPTCIKLGIQGSYFCSQVAAHPAPLRPSASGPCRLPLGPQSGPGLGSRPPALAGAEADLRRVRARHPRPRGRPGVCAGRGAWEPVARDLRPSRGRISGRLGPRSRGFSPVPVQSGTETEATCRGLGLAAVSRGGELVSPPLLLCFTMVLWHLSNFECRCGLGGVSV